MREYIAVVAWGGNISTINLTVGVFCMNHWLILSSFDRFFFIVNIYQLRKQCF
jgi:hypothetical protein